MTPVAATKTSSPETRSSCRQHAVDVVAGVEQLLPLLVVRGQSLPWIAPPMHLIAAAEITPSGVPPIPISMSTPVGLRGGDRGGDVAVADQVHARARLRAAPDQVSCRSRSSTTTVTSLTSSRFASRRRGRSRSASR